MQYIFLHITVKIVAFPGIELPDCCTAIRILSYK